MNRYTPAEKDSALSAGSQSHITRGAAQHGEEPIQSPLTQGVFPGQAVAWVGTCPTGRRK
jgi:hypothetical protein